MSVFCHGCDGLDAPFLIFASSPVLSLSSRAQLLDGVGRGRIFFTVPKCATRSGKSALTALSHTINVVLNAFRRDFGTASPASAPLERSSIPPTAAAAAVTSLGEQEYLSPGVDGSSFPAPPRATRSTLHNPFMVRSPGLQQQQQRQNKAPGPVEGV